MYLQYKCELLVSPDMNRSILNCRRESEQMEEMRMLKADEVAKRLGVSRTSAYGVIKMLNAELQEKGLITRSGRVSKDYFERRYFGGSEGIK